MTPRPPLAVPDYGPALQSRIQTRCPVDRAGIFAGTCIGELHERLTIGTYIRLHRPALLTRGPHTTQLLVREIRDRIAPAWSHRSPFLDLAIGAEP